jgi:hypothetical protein
MTETHAKVQDAMDDIRAKGTELATIGRDIIRETTVYNNGLAERIQERLDQIKAKRHGFA